METDVEIQELNRLLVKHKDRIAIHTRDMVYEVQRTILCVRDNSIIIMALEVERRGN